MSGNYLRGLYAAQFHAINYIANTITKIDSIFLGSVFSKLNDLAKLNALILIIKRDLVDVLNSKNDQTIQDVAKISEDLIQKITHFRNESINEFFPELAEKTLEQELLQTLTALAINDLNKLEECLTLKKDKKVVIFTCSFGTGHKITAAAVKQTLQKANTKVVIHDLSTGALLGRDRWRWLAKLLGVNYNDHPLNSVDIFNEILKQQLYFIINTKQNIDLFVRKMLSISGKDGVVSPLGILENSWEKNQIRDLLLMERPDHIVTSYHMDLNPILEVAEELGIPILHIPTDYDMKSWEVFGNTTPLYSHFKSAIPNHEIASTYQTKAPLNSNQLEEGIGIPLREEFYSFLSAEEMVAYRKNRQIDEEEKVLYLSGGGNGQVLPHPELLANSSSWKIPLRMMVIAGKNRDFVFQLQKNLKSKDGNPLILQGKNPYVTIEIVANPDPVKKGTEQEFFISAEELSKILDISDVALAKAGGLSVSELLFKGVPILFDQRYTPFNWELFNIQVAVEQNMGISHFSSKNLEQDLQKVLKLPRLSQTSNPHFYFEHGRERLSATIHKQIQEAELDEKFALRKGNLFLNLSNDNILESL